MIRVIHTYMYIYISNPNACAEVPSKLTRNRKCAHRAPWHSLDTLFSYTMGTNCEYLVANLPMLFHEYRVPKIPTLYRHWYPIYLCPGTQCTSPASRLVPEVPSTNAMRLMQPATKQHSSSNRLFVDPACHTAVQQQQQVVCRALSHVSSDGVATVSRIDKIICLFCRILSLL